MVRTRNKNKNARQATLEQDHVINTVPPLSRGGACAGGIEISAIDLEV